MTSRNIPCYVFDIDGTLADCSHRLHHIKKDQKDWDAYFGLCREDSPIKHMVRLVQELLIADNEIIYLSGRVERCRDDTVAWIHEHIWAHIPVQLWLRPNGDHRDDDILKSELMDRIIGSGYVPTMVFEDRDRVVKMWRARGIPCLQVADGDF